MFAVPVLKPTHCILDDTIQEIRSIDMRTRKVLSMTGNFQISRDVDYLYISDRKEEGVWKQYKLLRNVE